jgi:hypothetical protein
MRPLSSNSGSEHDRTAIENIFAAVFNRSESRPITQLKGFSRLFEICIGEVVQMEAIASGEYQVIESTKLRKESFDGLLVRKVKRLSLRGSAKRFNRLPDSFRVA